MGGLLVLLVTVCICFLILKFWFCFFFIPPKEFKAIRVRKVDDEKKKIKDSFSRRKQNAITLKKLLSKPMALKRYKELLKIELEVTQMTKGIKRRLLSDIKYDKIMQSQKSGKMGQDIVDILNSQ